MEKEEGFSDLLLTMLTQKLDAYIFVPEKFSSGSTKEGSEFNFHEFGSQELRSIYFCRRFLVRRP
mgnify:CR=1 FL=1